MLNCFFVCMAGKIWTCSKISTMQWYWWIFDRNLSETDETIIALLQKNINHAFPFDGGDSCVKWSCWALHHQPMYKGHVHYITRPVMLVQCYYSNVMPFSMIEA